VEQDCQARKLNTEDAMDRSRWRKLIKECLLIRIGVSGCVSSGTGSSR